MVRRVFVLITILLTVSLLSSVGFIQQAKAAGTTVVTVPANPLWTYTGLLIYVGDHISIIAWGTWGTQASLPLSPNGIDTTQGWFDSFFYFANRGELIAYIDPAPGSTAGPYQGHWGDKKFFPYQNLLYPLYWAVGNKLTFTSDRTGYLWLGINDDAVTEAVSDNWGSLTANVTISPGGVTLVGGYSISIEKPAPVSSFGGYIGLVALLGAMLCLTKTKKKK